MAKEGKDVGLGGGDWIMDRRELFGAGLGLHWHYKTQWSRSKPNLKSTWWRRTVTLVGHSNWVHGPWHSLRMAYGTLCFGTSPASLSPARVMQETQFYLGTRNFLFLLNRPHWAVLNLIPFVPCAIPSRPPQPRI